MLPTPLKPTPFPSYIPLITPLLSLLSMPRSADKDPQGCIFYQIFMEGALPGVTQGVPTVQQLLEGSLATGDLKFTEVRAGLGDGGLRPSTAPPSALTSPSNRPPPV